METLPSLKKCDGRLAKASDEISKGRGLVIGFGAWQDDECIADHADQIPRSSDGVLQEIACRAHMYSISMSVPHWIFGGYFQVGVVITDWTCFWMGEAVGVEDGGGGSPG